MNEDKFNLEMRSFLKKVGITSQREIEKAVQAAIAAGVLKGNESLSVKMTLEIDSPKTTKAIMGKIALE